MHKNHIFWLTPNIVSIVGGVIVSYWVTTIHTHSRDTEFWTNFLSSEFIYQWLLPLIVIGEGFTLGNSIWSFVSSKWKLVMTPVSIIISTNLTVLALYLSTNYLTFTHKTLFTTDAVTIGPIILLQFIALPMQFQNLHEILGVLHVAHNDFVYSQLTQYTYIGNNCCLIYLAILEFFVNQSKDISLDWFKAILYAGFCSCFAGMFMGWI